MNPAIILLATVGLLSSEVSEVRVVHTPQEKMMRRHLIIQTSVETAFALGDFISTERALTHDNVSEGNPLMRNRLVRVSLWTAWGVGEHHLRRHLIIHGHRRMAWGLTVFSVLLRGAIVIHNLHN